MKPSGLYRLEGSSQITDLIAFQSLFKVQTGSENLSGGFDVLFQSQTHLETPHGYLFNLVFSASNKS
jgi:hypothetical protein